MYMYTHICILYLWDPEYTYQRVRSVSKRILGDLHQNKYAMITCRMMAHSPCRRTRNSKVELHLGTWWKRLTNFKYSAHIFLVSYTPASVSEPLITLATYITSSGELFSNITAWSGMWPDTAGTHCSTVPDVLWYIRIWKTMMLSFFTMACYGAEFDCFECSYYV